MTGSAIQPRVLTEVAEGSDCRPMLRRAGAVIDLKAAMEITAERAATVIREKTKKLYAKVNSRNSASLA